MALDQQDSLGNEHLRDVEELEKAFRSDPSPEVFIPLGSAYLRRGYPRKAIDVLSKGLKRSDSPEGQLLLAQAYFDASAEKRTYLSKAANEIDGVISRNADSWDAHRLKGEIAIEQDDIQGAIKSLQKSYELNPTHPQARMLLQSLGVDVNDPPPADAPFYVNVETGFVPPQEDSLLKAIRDVSLFLIVVLAGVYLFAQNSINEKKVRALILLGRTQQNLDTYTGLKKAAHIYETVRKNFSDFYHPFALIHLGEVYHSLWSYHERTPENLKKFRDYYNMVTSRYDKKMLKTFAVYEALKMAIEYQRGREKVKNGDLSAGKEIFRRANEYLKGRFKDLPIHPRLNFMYGLLFEAMKQNRHARAHLKRAAELGWNSPRYRWRLAKHYLLTRSFAAAHSQFMSTGTQGKQSVNLINSFLTAPDKQKNEYCWIDPPLLFGGGAGVPKGLNLGTFDLLFESFMAASRADILSNCPFHPYFQKQYKASPNYLRAKIGDAISVLDSKVGMSVGYQLADELDKQRDAVKKEGNLSPHIDAWYYFAKAKAEYYKEEDKKADEFLKKALAKGGYEAFFHNLQGLLQVRAKKYDDAVTTFKKAYKMEPKLLQLYIESIEALLVVRDDDGKFTLKKQVEDLLGELKKVFGDHTDYLYLKGKLAAATGDDKDAEKLWTKALDSQKAPYYGDHYDANIAMGKLWMVRAKKYDRERKYKKSDYPELVAAFKVSDKKIRKNIKRDTQEKFLKKAYEQYDKFLAALKDEKRIPKKVMLLYTGSLREAIYEEAGAYFQTAMSSRPGSVESRMQTGLIYLNSKSWNDCVGHFTVAAVGHLRDLNYKGAKKAYTYLATALINGVDDKPRKKRKEKAEKVEQRFKFLATAELRKAYLKVATATDKKKKKDKKLSDSKKKHLLRTLDVLASVVEGTKLPKPAKELAETIREDIKVVKDKGIMTWFKVFKQRMQNKGKKGKRRRRRRR